MKQNAFKRGRRKGKPLIKPGRTWRPSAFSITHKPQRQDSTCLLRLQMQWQVSELCPICFHLSKRLDSDRAISEFVRLCYNSNLCILRGTEKLEWGHLHHYVNRAIVSSPCILVLPQPPYLPVSLPLFKSKLQDRVEPWAPSADTGPVSSSCCYY